jgi:Protease inhibitor Inh
MALFAPAAASRRAPLAVVVLAISAGLGGCGSDRTASGPQATSATPRAPANAPPMAGRWTLSSAGGSCAMNFAGAAGAGEGTVAPEGGCPGNFFTTRKWTFEGEALVVKDHKGDKLGQLTISGDRFEGQSTGGQAVSLSH